MTPIAIDGNAAQAPTATATATGPSSAPAMWAIVELFGHARIAGAISEHAFGGGALVQVDVPAITYTNAHCNGDNTHTGTQTVPGHTRSFGPAAIYSIHWCDEATANLAAHDIKHQPLRPYSLRAALAGMPDGERQRVLALTAGASLAAALDNEYNRGFSA